jgi:peptidoglycan hydrolase-like protein with peptidoglycan-binding domain
MPNPGQPTVRLNDEGDAVRRAQRGVRRGLPAPSLAVDGIFGPATESAVKMFQEGVNLAADGVVGPDTWAALPDGGPMPTLQEGSQGDIVRSLQEVLSGEWAPGLAVDGQFGPITRAAVEAFQQASNVAVDGIVGEQTWDASTGGMMHTLETSVGLQYVVD